MSSASPVAASVARGRRKRKAPLSWKKPLPPPSSRYEDGAHAIQMALLWKQHHCCVQRAAGSGSAAAAPASSASAATAPPTVSGTAATPAPSGSPVATGCAVALPSASRSADSRMTGGVANRTATGAAAPAVGVNVARTGVLYVGPPLSDATSTTHPDKCRECGGKGRGHAVGVAAHPAGLAVEKVADVVTRNVPRLHPPVPLVPGLSGGVTGTAPPMPDNHPLPADPVLVEPLAPPAAAAMWPPSWPALPSWPTLPGPETAAEAMQMENVAENTARRAAEMARRATESVEAAARSAVEAAAALEASVATAKVAHALEVAVAMLAGDLANKATADAVATAHEDAAAVEDAT